MYDGKGVSVWCHVTVWRTDHIRFVGLLHRRLHSHVLSQNSSQHESSSHTQLHCLALLHRRDVTRSVCSTSVCSARQPDTCPWPDIRPRRSMDVDEAKDDTPRGVLRAFVYILTHEAFFMIECVCNAWFTFELAIRLGLGLQLALVRLCLDWFSLRMFLNASHWRQTALKSLHWDRRLYRCTAPIAITAILKLCEKCH